METNSTVLFPGLEDAERNASMSPFDFYQRGRRNNNNSWGSNEGRDRSFQTMSSHTTDFETMFHHDEKEYWAETVKLEEEGCSPSVRKNTIRQIHRLMQERYRSRSEEDSVRLYIYIYIS